MSSDGFITEINIDFSDLEKARVCPVDGTIFHGLSQHCQECVLAEIVIVADDSGYTTPVQW